MKNLFVSYSYIAFTQDHSNSKVSGFDNMILEDNEEPSTSKGLENLTHTVDTLVAIRNEFNSVSCVILFFKEV